MDLTRYGSTWRLSSVVRIKPVASNWKAHKWWQFLEPISHPISLNSIRSSRAETKLPRNSSSQGKSYTSSSCFCLKWFDFWTSLHIGEDIQPSGIANRGQWAIARSELIKALFLFHPEFCPWSLVWPGFWGSREPMRYTRRRGRISDLETKNGATASSVLLHVHSLSLSSLSKWIETVGSLFSDQA